MRRTTIFFSVFLLGTLFFATACKEDEVRPEYDFSFEYDFETGMEGWAAVFADYPIGNEEAMNLSYKHTALPANLPQNRMALEISGANTSDDLVMMVKKKITGLKPNTVYDITFDMNLASQYPENSVGIGGSPGSSVVLKVGAVQEEPKAIEGDLGYAANVPNWDNRTPLVKGERTDDVVVIGNIGIEGDESVYEIINRNNREPDLSFSKKTDSQGELWVMVGTDSGFEGPTTLYYDAIYVYFTEKHVGAQNE